MELEEDFRVLLPDKLVHAITREITLQQEARDDLIVISN
jgi:hypothetical protein